MEARPDIEKVEIEINTSFEIVQEEHQPALENGAPGPDEELLERISEMERINETFISTIQQHEKNIEEKR